MNAGACAGALENLRIMEEERLPERAAEMGAYLLEKGPPSVLQRVGRGNSYCDKHLVHT